MQRYFSKQKEKNTLFLKEEDLYHIKTVMRMKKGDLIEVVYEKKLYICSYEEKEYVCIKKEENANIINTCVRLFIPLLKEAKLDLIIQKSTELGVDEIILYKAERSMIKIEEKKKESKFKRWNKISKEAAEQAKRLDIPNVLGIYELKNIIYPNDLNILCSTVKDIKSVKSVLQNHTKYDKINIIIGPEGGFAEKEEEILCKNGFQKVSLGKRIMRVETVPIFLMSIINYEYME